MKTNIINKTLALTAVAIALMGATTACVNDNSLCVEDQPGYEEGKDVWLSVNFRNVDSEGRSRAVTDPKPDHGDEDATAAENYIDGNDLTVMFLNSDGRVMKVFDKNEISVVYNDEVNYRDYELKFHINQDYFEKTGATSTFSLLVVANHNGTGDGQTYNPDNLWMKSVADLSALKTSFGYTGLNGTAAWTPDKDANPKRLIPMAGIHRFKVSRAALESATDANNPLVITDGGNEIDMQRAMAKIRVIDALAQNGNTDNVITAVTLSGMNNRGSYLPLVPSNDWGTQVVPNTSVCHIAHGDASWFSFSAESAARPSYAIGDNGWGFYIPEFSWTLAPAAAEPTLHITVHSASTHLDRTYDYPVSKSLGQNDMTRNHIYEFRVTEIAGMNLALTCTVLDWEGHETDWEFTDNVSMAQGGYITWTNGQVNPATATVTFNQTLTDLECRFAFQTPAGYTWRAVLIPQTGNLSAFSFVGETTGTIVPGEPITLKIHTSDSAPKGVNNTARLQILVSTPWGTTINAPVLDSNTYGTNKFFTINQNASI